MQKNVSIQMVNFYLFIAITQSDEQLFCGCRLSLPLTPIVPNTLGKYLHLLSIAVFLNISF
jgi:hypothetical protein